MPSAPQIADQIAAPPRLGDAARAGGQAGAKILFAAIGVCAAAGVLAAGLLSPAAADWPTLLKYSSMILLLCAALGLWVTAEPGAGAGKQGLAEANQERALRVAAALDRDGGAIVAVAAELARADDDMRAHLAGAADGAEATRLLAERAERLAASVRNTCADSARAADIASRMAETAHQAQTSVATVAGQTGVLARAADSVELVLGRAARLAASPQDAILPAPFAAEASSALAQIGAAIGLLGDEAAQSAARLAQLSELIEAQHAFAAKLEATIHAQAEDIMALLEALGTAHGGVASLRAGADAIRRHKAAHEESFSALRKTALRLPDYADTVALMFRDASEAERRER